MKRVMLKPLKSIIPAAFLLFTMGAYPQAMKTDHWSPAQLMQRAQHLKQLAAQGDGSASETLDKYPHHFTMLAFRSHSGGAEQHQNFADLFYIVEGKVSLVTGGTIAGVHTTGPGEIRGTSVQGGSTQELKAGDVVHIPAGMPHQMLLPPGGTLTYFVVKIEETR